MKEQLKLEEFGLFILGCYLFSQLEISWWWFFGLLLTPDIGMLGYLFGNKVGAYTYNFFHHRGVAILFYLVGTLILQSPVLELVGIILFSHTAMDRIVGYGLKYEKGFKYTHLGEIGS
ncbi:DUF4260 domain-containing protein [Croceivirga thetidis]|uniref:DUF4260 domain-containing protein n=1 Tax=Croceivirga thetidis TaxID=2721623 RepID=A0ABX1GNU4_9FLAO|nr:DUF4260 domain-containing protein [Croceivirga thetidis]NKI30730.1 DUF4260 domain-containing protein [Croceivirga thetidis]